MLQIRRASKQCISAVTVSDKAATNRGKRGKRKEKKSRLPKRGRSCSISPLQLAPRFSQAGFQAAVEQETNRQREQLVIILDTKHRMMKADGRRWISIAVVSVLVGQVGGSRQVRCSPSKTSRLRPGVDVRLQGDYAVYWSG
jgi:hypothetical protein